MKSQKGVSMLGLIGILVVLVIVAGLGMKVGPVYLEYMQVKKAVAAIVESGEVGAGSVGDVRKAFDKRAQVDDIQSITAQDLDISKEGGNLVISFSYPKRVPLAGNVSLMFDFAGSSKK